MTPIVFLLLLTAADTRIVIHIAEKDLPPAVHHTSRKDIPKSAKVTGYEKLTVNGVDFFEVKIEVNGYVQELLYRKDGSLELREEETTIDQIPAPARAAILKAAKDGILRKIDVIRKPNVVHYEGELLLKGEKSKVIFDAQGKPQKQ